MKRSDILIIGGGVIGSACAYFLSKRGARVIVVEKKEVGSQASSAAAGLLAPLRPLGREDPFKTLQLAGLARFSSFIPELEEVSGIPVGYQGTGTLRILPPEKVVPARAWVEVWKSKGYRMDLLTPEQACAYEPLLLDSPFHAVYIADEAQVVPTQLVKAFAQAARRMGTLFYEHTSVVALERAGDRIEGVWTQSGELLRGNHLIIAAGNEAAVLGSWLGAPLSIRPIRGEIIAIKQPSAPSQLQHIIFDEGVYDEDVYVAPKPDNTVIIGATKADVGFDTSVTAGGIQHLLDVALRLLPTLANSPFVRTWAGLRPKTPDSRPVLGFLPPWANVTIAGGPGGFGITLSIVIGEAIAELVTTGQCPAIIQPFAPQSSGSVQSNELTAEEQAALPFYCAPYSEQQVKAFAVQWAVEHFVLGPEDRANVKIREFSWNPVKGHWHCLVEYAARFDDVLLTIVERDQALFVETFIDYPPP